METIKFKLDFEDLVLDEQSNLNLKYYENSIFKVIRNMPSFDKSVVFQNTMFNNSRSAINNIGYGYLEEFESLCRSNDFVSKKVCQNRFQII